MFLSLGSEIWKQWVLKRFTFCEMSLTFRSCIPPPDVFTLFCIWRDCLPSQQFGHVNDVMLATHQACSTPPKKGALCLPEGPTPSLVVWLVPLGRAVACTWHRQVCLLKGSVEAELPNTSKVNPGFFNAYWVLFHENRGGQSHLHLRTRLPLSGL